MKNSVIFFVFLSIYGCNTASENKVQFTKRPFETTKPKTVPSEDDIQGNTSDSKIFYQCDPNCIWKYHHPFADSSYVFAVQNCGEENIEKSNNARIYFGINRGITDKVIWVEDVSIKTQDDYMEYQDFNGDDVKDIMVFSETGARGSNSYYFLYLVNAKNKTVTRIKGFENIVNPDYDKKNNIIVSYAYSGTNHYSIYKISNTNRVDQIGSSFEDNFDGDTEILNVKIKELLKRNK